MTNRDSDLSHNQYFPFKEALTYNKIIILKILIYNFTAAFLYAAKALYAASYSLTISADDLGIN